MSAGDRLAHDVALAGLELLEADRRIGRDGEDQVVDLGPAGPMLLERLVADHGVLLVGHELEGAGADRLEVELLRRAGLHHLVGILGRHHDGEVLRQERHEGGVGIDQRHLHGVVVDLLDALDQVRQPRTLKVLVSAARDLAVGMVRIELAVDREEDIVGVEVARRREVVRRLPLHTLAQLEGVDQAVVGDLKLSASAGFEVGGAALGLEQPVEDWARSWRRTWCPR